jgi:peptidylprolyl isomerase
MKLATFIVLVSSLFAEPDKALLSEGFGHMIGTYLELLEVDFDTASLIKGIEDARAGKESPLSDQECAEAIELAQKKNLKELSKKNLKQAEAFLASHAKEEGVISLEKGKLQYQVLSQGKGSEIKPHSSPLIRYTVRKLDGSLLCFADQAEPVSLDQTIPGLKAGLVGMREGEKRALYIHPDLAYGTKGTDIFPPNMLLIFEIEILRS